MEKSKNTKTLMNHQGSPFDVFLGPPPTHRDTDAYEKGNSMWELPEAYKGPSLLFTNNAKPMLCFIWCIGQRSLLYLPPEIIQHIWKYVSWTIFDDYVMYNGTPAKVPYNGPQFNWQHWDQFDDDDDIPVVPSKPNIPAAPAA